VVTAKWLADRYSAMLGQEALTDFITSGRFERYLRRACALNAARRLALVEALHQHLGDRIEIAGENAGVHMLVWLNGVARGEVGGLITRAAEAGVGLYPIDAYFSRPPPRAGLLFGYASLTDRDIRAGVKRFAQVLDGK
jgi:GntR family transcriptional regulator/MocR family aminotransferase